MKHIVTPLLVLCMFLHAHGSEDNPSIAELLRFLQEKIPMRYEKLQKMEEANSMDEYIREVHNSRHFYEDWRRAKARGPSFVQAWLRLENLYMNFESHAEEIAELKLNSQEVDKEEMVTFRKEATEVHAAEVHLNTLELRELELKVKNLRKMLEERQQKPNERIDYIMDVALKYGKRMRLEARAKAEERDGKDSAKNEAGTENKGQE